LSSTAAVPKSPSRRHFGRRILGSSLVGALTSPHPIDRYLELVRPAWSVSEARADVVDVRHMTGRSVTLTLRPNANWPGFRAGQFINLTVEIDGVRRTRCYSPAYSQYVHGAIEITVTRHPEGLVSNHLAEHARPGMTLFLSEPDGDFVMPDIRPDRMLLISGGSGVTPLMSMLRTLDNEGHDGPVTFLHYARSREDEIYSAELTSMAARRSNFRIVRSFPRDETGADLNGHFVPSHLHEAEPRYADATTFVCGPPALIDGVRATLALEDLEKRLHVEHFVPPAPAVVLGEAEGTVRFACSGVDADNTGAPLLDQAEAAGLVPPSGCRMGICHSCTCRKVSGGIRNVNTGEVSTTPDEDIQICISVPVGDVELAI